MRTFTGLLIAGLVGLPVLLLGPALAQTPAPLRPLTEGQAIELGRQLAQRNCSQCHAIGVTGDSPSPQAPPFRELYQRGDVEMLGEGTAQGILTRHTAMPEFRFAPHELVALVRYLRSVQARRET